MPPVADDARVTPAYLILNPASGGAALLLRRLNRAARERGIQVRVLAPGTRLVLDPAPEGAAEELRGLGAEVLLEQEGVVVAKKPGPAGR